MPRSRRSFSTASFLSYRKGIPHSECDQVGSPQSGVCGSQDSRLSCTQAAWKNGRAVTGSMGKYGSTGIATATAMKIITAMAAVRNRKKIHLAACRSGRQRMSRKRRDISGYFLATGKAGTENDRFSYTYSAENG